MKFNVCGALALLLCASLSVPAEAQSSISSAKGDQLIETYTAFIGPKDIVNSNGQKLTQPWQVVRQDRANYHRYGIRDRLDENDTFFSDANNRAALEDMLRHGSISKDAARDLLSGHAVIQVEIYGHGDVGTSVEITTSR
ncbi:MAG TPA: hypothetical protein VGM83_18780 [Devosiaceae bacterium]|jgi:hypothetical protein